MKDRLVFKPGSVEENERTVDWWFIYKLKGFSDVYLYFDSEMKSSDSFLKGNFLRSKYSALGATMEKYSIDDKNEWFAWNDHNIDRNGKKENSFYRAGAHEKGFIGYKSDLSEGFFIQHSLPNWPVTNSDNKNLINPPVPMDLNFKNNNDRERMERLFPFYGWTKPFFPKNLMTSFNPGGVSKSTIKKSDSSGDIPFKAGDDDKEKEVDNSNKKKRDIEFTKDVDFQTDYEKITIKYKYQKVGLGVEKSRVNTFFNNLDRMNTPSINIEDSNPYATVYSSHIKPTQHIFCSNIDDKDNLMKLIMFLSYLSQEGIYSYHSNIKNDEIGEVMKKYKDSRHPIDLTLEDNSDDENMNLIDPINDPEYLDSIKSEQVELGGMDVYMKINAAQESYRDVWASLEDKRNHPFFVKDSNSRQLLVSTWSSYTDFYEKTNLREKKLKFSDNTFSINVRVGGLLQTVEWTSKSNSEHSKIGVIENYKSDEPWNVCLSGGNIYKWGRLIKSSLLVSDAILALKAPNNKEKNYVKDFSKKRKLASHDLYTEVNVLLKEEIKYKQSQPDLQSLVKGKAEILVRTLTIDNPQKFIQSTGSPIRSTTNPQVHSENVPRDFKGNEDAGKFEDLVDRLVFNPGSVEENERTVDWWFIYKLKGFSDVYLYFDSEMKSGDSFKKGHFLRSKYSALGATMEKYSIDDKNEWFAWNDHNIDEDGKKENSFYRAGAHEKGFIGYESDLSQGFFIQHSLPNWPVTNSDNEKLINPPVQMDLNFKNNNDRERMERLFPFYGWAKPFFPRNLMTSFNPGGVTKKNIFKADTSGDVPFKAGDDDKEKEVDNSEKKKKDIEFTKYVEFQTDVKKITIDYKYLKVSLGVEKKEVKKFYNNLEKMNTPSIAIGDSNPYSTVYTSYIKPTQHIFCSNIDGKENLMKLLEFLSYLSKFGLSCYYSNIKNDEIMDAKSQNRNLRTETDLTHEDDSVDTDMNLIDPINDPMYLESIKSEQVELGGMNVYMKINAAEDSYRDVWASLEDKRNHPWFERVPKSRQLLVSTWSSNTKFNEESDMREKKLKFSDNTFSINVRVGGLLQTVEWTSKSNSEHSKIGVIENYKSDEPWNVCLSGGNIYKWADAILALTAPNNKYKDYVKEYSKEKKLASHDLYTEVDSLLKEEIRDHQSEPNIKSLVKGTAEILVRTLTINNPQKFIQSTGSPIRSTTNPQVHSENKSRDFRGNREKEKFEALVDRVVFNPGTYAKEEKTVDWWFIYKLKGFSDVYLYYDSDMKSGDPFLKGHFLRSKYSALGATMEKYSIDDKNEWFAWNDHNIDENGKKENSFYQDGAHEKGFIGYESDLSKGFFIQHSLPNWPVINPKNDRLINPPSNVDLHFKNDADRERMERLFPFYSWGKPFFPSTLMTSFNPGGKDVSKSNIQKYDAAGDDPFNAGDDDKETLPDDNKKSDMEFSEFVEFQTDVMSKTISYSYITVGLKPEKRVIKDFYAKLESMNAPQIYIGDTNPYATVYTSYIKPTQHIFCSNIDGKENLIKLLEFLSHLSNYGLSSFFNNIKKNDEVIQAKDKNREQRKKSDFTLGENSFETEMYLLNPLEDPKYLKAIKSQEIILGGMNVYMKINAAKECRRDIWTSLEDKRNHPFFQKVDPEGDRQLLVSTWSSNPNFKESDNARKGKIKFSDNTFSINVRVGGLLQTVEWTSKSNSEHSKIGVIKGYTDEDPWNVCLSGGNIYKWGRVIKSSLLVSDAILSLTAPNNKRRDYIKEYSKEKKMVSHDLYSLVNELLREEIIKKKSEPNLLGVVKEIAKIKVRIMTIDNAEKLIKPIGSPLRTTTNPQRSYSIDAHLVHGSRTHSTGLVATVFGVTGFTGRYIVQLLTRTGIQVVVPFRGEDYSFRDLKVLGELGQVIPTRYDIRDTESIERAISHSNIVINMISRQYETINFNYEDVNVTAATKLAEIAKRNNVEKYIHFSALRASEDSASKWSSTKAKGERLVREIIPDCTVVRPGLVFGDEDRLINKWSRITQVWPFLPRFNQDKKFQPLHCFDLASAVLGILELPYTNGKTYELGGDEIFTWEQFNDMIIEGTAQFDKKSIDVSHNFMKNIALITEKLRDPSFIRDELEYQNQDLLVSPDALGLKDLNVKPTPIQEKLIRLSRMYRPSRFFNAIANPQIEKK
eukprot:gene2636-3274_t